MMRHHATRIARRATAAGLLVGLLAAVWTLVVGPLWGQIDDGKARISAKREHLSRYLALAESEADVRAALEQVTTSNAGNQVFSAQSRAIAAADLQIRLTSLAAANRVSFRSARLLPARDESDAVLIGVRVHLSGGLREMQTVIHTIESAVPFMFIDAVQMTGGATRQVAGAIPQLKLDVQLDVYGLFQASTSE